MAAIESNRCRGIADNHAIQAIEMQAERKLPLGQFRGIAPPDQLTKKQKQTWEYMMFHPGETNLSAIARGAGVNRHTAAKHYELIREMAGDG